MFGYTSFIWRKVLVFNALGFHDVVSQRKASGRRSLVDRFDTTSFSFGFDTVFFKPDRGHIWLTAFPLSRSYQRIADG